MPRLNLTRLIAIGLTAAAVAPASAAAVPAIDGQGIAAGGGPGVTSQSLQAPAKPAIRGGDVVGGGGYVVTSKVVPGPPQFPTNTKSLAPPSAQSKDDGIDTGVVIALGAAALLAVGGVALVLATRPARRRQPA